MLIRLSTFALAAILSFLHYLYACKVGYWLYQQSSGVHLNGKWTHYGDAAYAWTIPIQLPGGIIAAYTNRELGALLMLFSEVSVAYAIASVLTSTLVQKTSIFGRYKWKAIVIVFGLIWIPVPETVAWVYEITVAY